ncbi:MAG: hypothetical protein ACYDEF_00475, partial [Methanosarcina sp.]
IFFDLCFVLTIEFEQNYPNIYSSFIILEIGLYNHCLRVGEVLSSILIKEPILKLKNAFLNFKFQMTDRVSDHENGSKTLIDVKINWFWDELKIYFSRLLSASISPKHVC